MVIAVTDKDFEARIAIEHSARTLAIMSYISSKKRDGTFKGINRTGV